MAVDDHEEQPGELGLDTPPRGCRKNLRQCPADSACSAPRAMVGCGRKRRTSRKGSAPRHAAAIAVGPSLTPWTLPQVNRLEIVGETMHGTGRSASSGKQPPRRHPRRKRPTQKSPGSPRTLRPDNDHGSVASRRPHRRRACRRSRRVRSRSAASLAICSHDTPASVSPPRPSTRSAPPAAPKRGLR